MMNNYAWKTLNIGDFSLIILIFGICLSISLIFFGTFYFIKRIRFVSLYVLISCMTFGLLGYIVGFIMSMSREPSVDAIIPALLTIAGGLMIYVMTGKGLATRLVILCALASFSLNILVGTLSGSRLRASIEHYQRFQIANQDESIRQYIEFRKMTFDENIKNHRNKIEEKQ